MNERSIQNGLFSDLQRKGYLLCCPNYSPAGWFECDLWAVTKANRFVEFEIKVSRSDFKADARKGPSEREKQFRKTWRPEQFDGRTKHERLAMGDPNGPSRFYYVVPTGLVAPEEVPEWAGLMYASEYHGMVILKTAVKARKLHNNPVEERTLQHMASVFYWRFWSLRRGLKETEVAG